ncbi:uncharacterized protein BT62DRAFT_1079450 [Guyanagaster necrorhizus]|uniref:Uncharacterized protein n=1 Tax=Guyanagaster necrorhizus TaxID=856835 RepID=A0A9P7VLZ4_9AGAR|nr:uncharacterized protein BT62DRAFT_1079450 [Guyanagaster necrorhizus MCA 3950]KAG7442349.1 hypothetical protein BT62DRAFT_1079450 [Guyanagaster necrorhizus MCA 3950]
MPDVGKEGRSISTTVWKPDIRFSVDDEHLNRCVVVGVATESDEFKLYHYTCNVTHVSTLQNDPTKSTGHWTFQRSTVHHNHGVNIYNR